MILLLDNYPKSIFKIWWIKLKIFIKEGIILGDWKEVFRKRDKGGSVFIPQIIAKLLKKNFKVVHNKLTQNYFDTVFVVNDIDCLKWAIQQKEKGKVGQLLVGPFVQNHPHEYHAKLLSSQIDKELFFSQWHQDLFVHFAPELKNRKLFNWFCGVDSDFWKPNHTTKPEKSVLVYLKTHETQMAQPIIDFLINQGFRVEIIRATKYSWDEYKTKLNRANLAIFISVTETQGLAIFESWSMNVPTYHWNCKQWNYQGLHYQNASSCPYLNDDLGDDFADFEEFKNSFLEKYPALIKLQPRNYVLSHFTMKHSQNQLYKIITE